MTLDRRAVLGLAAGGLLAACGRKDDVSTAESTTQAKPTLVRFATDWRAEAEHGGFYQALATGEYARRGLDVRIIQGGPGVNVPQLLASGAAEMGIGSNSFIVMNLAAEKAPVKVVSATFQKDPQVLIAHPESGIEKIADMKGHPILLADASITAFWVWLKAKYGFTDDMVRKYTFNPAPFLADKRSVMQGYVTSEPYTIETEAHFKPKVFLLADEGYPGYAAMVMASLTLIEERPEIVQAFVDASAAGWVSYLNGDPRPGDALIRRDNPEMRQDVLDQARQKLKSYGIVESGDAVSGRVGVMTAERWKAFYDIAASQGVYPKSLDYQAAFDLQFAPRLPR
jgi:NitT/TauT family transport system substrate-binding protein